MKRWKPIVALVLGIHGVDACAGWLGGAGLELRADDNVTRAQLAQDIKSDSAVVLSATADSAYRPTGNSSLSLALALSGSAYQHYQGLDNLNAELELAYRWKFGLGPYVPELHLSAAAVRLEYRDGARDGWLYEGEIGLAKRLSDRAGIRIAYQMEQRKSDNVAPRLDGLPPEITANVFDLTSRKLSLGADYSLSPDYVLAATYSLRDGDIVSTTLRNFPIFLASSAIATDSVFGPDRYAYTMQARTRGLSLGLSRVIGGHASFSIGYERLYSLAEHGIDYTSNLVRATYLHQF
jgi:hypothetical protein